MLYYFVFASLTLGMSQDANSDYYSHTSYHSSSSLDITDESLAIDILDEYNGEVTKYYGNVLGKKFAYYTNYTKENLNLLVSKRFLYKIYVVNLPPYCDWYWKQKGFRQLELT